MILYMDTKGKTPDEKFDKYDNSLDLMDKIKNSEMKLAETKNGQIRFKSNLKRKQQKKIKRAKKHDIQYLLYKARNEAIKFFGEYSSRVSEGKIKARNEGKRLKILTPKKLLQMLPIALAQVKAGNNSENVLNEIRKIAYSLYQSNEITKKVYNNIIKSIQSKILYTGYYINEFRK